MYSTQETNDLTWNGGILVFVYLRDKAVFGEILQENAHAALIKYENDGKLYEEWFNREDYVIWQKAIIDYMEEDI